MKRLMHDSMAAAEQGGYDFALLGGLRQRYAHYGFELAGIDPVFIFTADNARYLFGKDVAQGYTFQTVTHSDETLLDLRSFGSVPIAFFDVTGEYAGYLLARANGAVWEFRPLQPEHALRVLADYTRAGAYEQLTIHRVGAHETALLRTLSDGCEDCALRRCDSIRIFRYETTLRAYLASRAMTTPLPDGSLVLGFANDEVLQMTVSDGKSTVVATEREPLYTLSHADAVKLLFGPFTLFSDCGYLLPAAARAWFPRPFALNAADDS